MPSAARRGETVGIVGAGAFGTALARVLASAGRAVLLLPYPVPTQGGAVGLTADLTADLSAAMTRGGPEAAPGSVEVVADPAQLAAGARLIVLAVPSIRLDAALVTLSPALGPDQLVVHAVGALPLFEAPAGAPVAAAMPQAGGAVAGSAMAGAGIRRPSELVRLRTAVRRIGALAGPALPADLAAGRPCAIVAASGFDEVTRAAVELLSASPVLRVYTSRDLAGVELASALSGAMCIGLGVADGLAVGEGPRALVVTRAVSEMARICVASSVGDRACFGMAGLGNLLARATATSGSSDYRLGLALVHGDSGGGHSSGGHSGGGHPVGGHSGGGHGGPDAPVRETEGSRAALSGTRLARARGLRTPLLDLVVAVVYHREPVATAVERLLASHAGGE